MNPILELARRAQEAKASNDNGDILARYLEVDMRLQLAGFPATSPWWLEEIRDFFTAGVLQWVARVGRRGGKSTTLCRVAVVWALYGDWSVPKGDTAIVPFVSINRSEAHSRLRTIAEILDALGINYESRPGELEIHTPRHVIFRVQACTVGAVSGFTAIAAFCDEVSKWRTADTGANPAHEVVKSLKPTLATQLHGFIVLSSSPWTKDDFHAREFDRGDGNGQITSWAPTWVANPMPEVTEERTHELERDEPTWRREYAAIPSDVSESNWFGQALMKAITCEEPPEYYGTRYTIAIDAAFQGDLFGWAVVASHKDRGTGRRITWTHASGAWTPAELEHSPTRAAEWVKEKLCERYGTRLVHGDQHEASSFAELARQAGWTLEVVPWLGGSAKESKTQRFRAVRTAMLDGTFRIPNDPDLHTEMRHFSAVYTNGSERVVWDDPPDVVGHGDRTTALMLAGSIALSLSAQDIKDAPVNHPVGSREYWEAEAKRMREEAVKKATKRQRDYSRAAGFR